MNLMPAKPKAAALDAHEAVAEAVFRGEAEAARAAMLDILDEVRSTFSELEPGRRKLGSSDGVGRLRPSSQPCMVDGLMSAIRAARRIEIPLAWRARVRASTSAARLRGDRAIRSRRPGRRRTTPRAGR